MADVKKYAKRALQDETYINIWRWLVEETQGHRVIIVFAAIVILVILAVTVINVQAWPPWTGLGKKTAWDMADLLFIPLALVIIAYIFNKRQKEYELEVAQKQREQEREIADDRIEEVALQNYFDKMTELILPPNNLRKSDKDSEVRVIARARTLTVLRELNAVRKGSVLRFLSESGLIDTENTIIGLTGADLKKADLSRTYLSSAHLVGTNLSNAKLNGADLRNANLSAADLSKVDFSGANLGGAILSAANLRGASLKDASLKGAQLTSAYLNGADMRAIYLDEAILHTAECDNQTKWPRGFDPHQAGVIKKYL